MEPKKSGSALLNAVESLDGSATQFFSTSDDSRSDELMNYLAEKTRVSFNAYCVECKSNKSTHFCVLFGTFTCAECKDKLVQFYGGHHAVIPKQIFTE